MKLNDHNSSNDKLFQIGNIILIIDAEI